MIGAKSGVKYIILQILSHNLLTDRMVYNTTPTQIRLIISLAEMMVVYSIFLFNDFSNNILRGFKYIYYFNLLILKDIFDNDATITLIFLSDFLIREILENNTR